MDEVRVDVPSQGKTYVFACHRWLDTKEEDGQIEIEMTPTTVEKSSASELKYAPPPPLLIEHELKLNGK